MLLCCELAASGTKLLLSAGEKQRMRCYICQDLCFFVVVYGFFKESSAVCIRFAVIMYIL